MFNRKIIFNPGPFSSAMLVYQSVYSIAMQDFPEGDSGYSAMRTAKNLTHIRK